MTRARGAAALFLSLALVLPGCKRDETPDSGADTTVVEESSPVEVTGVTLGRAVGPDKRITDETTTFRPGDTIYVSIATEGVAPNATLNARWTYQDGQNVDENSLSIAPNGPEATEFHISKPDGWPAGSYEVVISLDGREVDRKSFSVEAGS